MAIKTAGVNAPDRAPFSVKAAIIMVSKNMDIPDVIPIISVLPPCLLAAVKEPIKPPSPLARTATSCMNFSGTFPAAVRIAAIRSKIIAHMKPVAPPTTAFTKILGPHLSSLFRI